MQNVLKFLRGHGKAIGLIALGVLLASGLFIWHLSGLTAGLFSKHEATLEQATYGWHGLWNHPLYLPFVAIWSVLKLIGSPVASPFWWRLPSVFAVIAAVICFGIIVRAWLGTRTAVLSTLLFAASAWTLHVGRLIGYEALLLLVIPVLFAVDRLLHKAAPSWLRATVTLIIWGLTLYLPGGIWLVAVQIGFHGKYIGRSWQAARNWWQRVLMVLSGVIWLSLLISYLIRSSDYETALGLPSHLPAFHQLGNNFLNVLTFIFLHGPTNRPDLWLSTSPVLDLFTLICFILGLYYYLMHLSSGRSRLILISFMVSLLLVGLGGPVGFSLLVPLLYLFAATGIAYLLLQWLKVFPRNPVARSVGITLIVLAVAVSCLYNVRAYFIAWPHATATHQAFRYKA